MNNKTFWELIEAAKNQSGGDDKLHVKLLTDALATFSEDDIIAFGRLFDLYDAIAELRLEDVCAEVFASGDSGLKDFCGWVFAQGRSIFWNAFHNPDSLADAAQQDDDVFFELIRYVAYYAYQQKTGRELPAGSRLFRWESPPQRRIRAVLKQEMIAQKYPKLTAKVAAYRSIEDKFTGLIGQKAWGVKLGDGSFITIEFGEPRTRYSAKLEREAIHGEWHLWIYDAVWSLEKDKSPLVNSEDGREKIQEKIMILDAAIVKEMFAIVPDFYSGVLFENGLILRMEPSGSRDMIHWILFTPEKKVLQAGPGKNWSYEDE